MGKRRWRSSMASALHWTRRRWHGNISPADAAGGRMRILAVADLHYALPQFDWLIQMAPRYDLVIIAGDLLDGASLVTPAAQMVVVLKYLERLRAITPLMVCSGNHDLNHVYSTGEKYARWVPYVRSAVAHA
ncbi:MAG: metallophosphoesterase, partial [Sphingomonadales bacterium]